MRRRLISVETLVAPTRQTLLKSLADNGIPTLDTQVDANSFAVLVRRLRALTKTHEAACGSWVLALPRHPLVRDVYTRAARALAHRLGLQDTVHVMVCPDTDAHEAFESMICADPLGTQDTTLENVTELADMPAPVCHAASPFKIQIIRLSCPEYMADNPVISERVAAELQAALTRGA